MASAVESVCEGTTLAPWLLSCEAGEGKLRGGLDQLTSGEVGRREEREEGWTKLVWHNRCQPGTEGQPVDSLRAPHHRLHEDRTACMATVR